MSAASQNHLTHGEALSAARYAKNVPQAQHERAGSTQIGTVVLPFLDRAREHFRSEGLKLDYGVRKFDSVTQEKWSVYFRAVNLETQQSSPYYIIDLSSRIPLLIKVDTLDIGSSVRRREACDQTLQSHDQITTQVLGGLLDRAKRDCR